MLSRNPMLSRKRNCSRTPKHSLCALKWIVQVNGKPTSDLDAFVNMVKELRPDECVRVKTVDLDGKPQVLTLKQDLHYILAYAGVETDPDTAMWRMEMTKASDCSNGYSKRIGL